MLDWLSIFVSVTTLKMRMVGWVTMIVIVLPIFVVLWNRLMSMVIISISIIPIITISVITITVSMIIVMCYRISVWMSVTTLKMIMVMWMPMFMIMAIVMSMIVRMSMLYEVLNIWMWMRWVKWLVSIMMI